MRAVHAVQLCTTRGGIFTIRYCDTFSKWSCRPASAVLFQVPFLRPATFLRYALWGSCMSFMYGVHVLTSGAYGRRRPSEKTGIFELERYDALMYDALCMRQNICARPSVLRATSQRFNKNGPEQTPQAARSTVTHHRACFCTGTTRRLEPLARHSCLCFPRLLVLFPVIQEALEAAIGERVVEQLHHRAERHGGDVGTGERCPLHVRRVADRCG